jgi:Cof subfamily protein (haloacid dehalogenase superfamily)
MPIRLIALDLDGTLVNSRWEISQTDVRALTAAWEQGIHVVIVTGRRYLAAMPYVRKLPFPVTTISSNGAMIRTASGKVEYQNLLPREIALQVLEAVRPFRPYTVVIFDLPGQGQVTMEECAIPAGPLGWYLKNSLDQLLLVPNLEASVGADPIQVMIGGPPADISEAETAVSRSAISTAVHLTWTKYPERNIALFDVMNLGCSKGQALKFWAQHCGIPATDIMAMGDNFNDVEMLEFAGLPVIMGNHIDGLHRPGWEITSHCDESGVACAVERFVLKG